MKTLEGMVRSMGETAMPEIFDARKKMELSIKPEKGSEEHLPPSRKMRRAMAAKSRKGGKHDQP